MVNKMAEFPNDIAIDKPVPGKCGFNNSMLLKKANAKYH
jgi:hypothetical protein